MKTGHLTVLAVAGLTAAAVLGGCSSTGSTSAAAPSNTVVYQADYPEYASLTDAVDAASVVVTGSIVDQHTVEIHPDASADTNPATNPQAGVPAAEAAQVPGVVTTVFDVRVSSVLEGDVAVGDVVEVSQLGGTLNGVTYVEKGTPALQPSQEYVLFLAAHGAGNPYDVINPDQGVYRVTGGTFVPAGGHGFKGLSRAAIAKARH